MHEARDLEREAQVFCRYLCGELPNAYVIAKYRAAHECGAVAPAQGVASFDRILVGLARSSSVLVRPLDAYARVFAKGGLLRRKLVALLAILETRAPYDDAVDTPTGKSVVAFCAQLVALGVVFALSVLVVAILLLPIRIGCALRGG